MSPIQAQCLTCRRNLRRKHVTKLTAIAVIIYLHVSIEIYKSMRTQQ